MRSVSPPDLDSPAIERSAVTRSAGRLAQAPPAETRPSGAQAPPVEARSSGAKAASVEARSSDMETTIVDGRGSVSVPALDGARSPLDGARSRLDGARRPQDDGALRLGDALWRALELTLTGLLLLALLPLLALIALVVRLDSPGPVLFRQRRVGRAQQPFTVNKFRTMHDGVGHDTHRAFVLGLIAGEEPEPREDGPRFKLVGDERVTRIGRFLRRSSLDELPQLWNVLRGDMSLVGPRPPIPYEVEHYPAHWFARFAAKPGLTGLWQVSGRSELTLEQMVALDIEYVQRRSLWLNISILARTVPAVLSTRGAS
jgi:lipopolysaccharide/colanic/teichoic acid biosynthesis glycosyltransferase